MMNTVARNNRVLRFFGAASLAVSALMLGACGTLFGDDGLFPSRNNDYLAATELPPLLWPEEIGAPTIEDAYPIPALKFSKVLPDSFAVPRVEPLDEVAGKGSVRIQRFKNDEWILVQRAPSQTWPLLLSFLASNQIALARSDPQAGVVETDLLSDAGGKLESYRFTLGAGVQKNSTEVRVQHLFRKREDARALAENSDDARRKNMLTLLAEQFANSPDRSSHSLLAQGLGTASKVQLRYEEGGEPYLLLELPYDRGWASLGLALKKASFDVRDLDRNEGQYLAAYIDKAKREKKPGVVKRLFTRKRDGEDEANDAPLMVRAQQSGEGIKITLQRREQPLLQPNEQAFLLRKILQKLS